MQGEKKTVTVEVFTLTFTKDEVANLIQLANTWGDERTKYDGYVFAEDLTIFLSKLMKE